jgi:arsenate reductase (glutaredoxin)
LSPTLAPDVYGMIMVMTSKTITVYGIPNCDTVKKARAWLTAQGLDYEFHDFKKQGVPEAQLDNWLQQVGWEKLVNRKGNTWRTLDAATQSRVVDAASAKQVILLNSSVVKRPVVHWHRGQITVGFDTSAWQALCSPA